MADPKFIPVDDDPFAESTGPKLVPVDGDPFADGGLKVTPVDDDPFDGQEPIDESWLEVGKKVLENAPTQLKAGLTGLQQKMAEQPPTVLGSLMMPVPITGKPGDPTIPDFLSMLQKQGSDWMRDKMGLEPDKGAEVAAQAFADTQADLQENAPNVDPNSLKGYAYDTAGSFIQMLPGIAAGLATKSPAVGVTTMAAPIAGERYARSRTAGRTPSQATEDATVTGLAEAIPEMIPLGFLMKPGKKFLARTLGTMGLGGASEMLTQAIEDGYAKGVLNEDMTWGDVWDNIKRAGVIGMVSEGLAASVTHPFVKERSPGAGNTAGDAAGPPTGESAGLPPASPPPTGGPATTTPAPGMVRLYHGGADPTNGGGRWVTTDETYARGYAEHNSGDATQVHYVDVPVDAPWLKKSDYFDEDGRVFNQEVPEAIAKSLRPLGPPAASTPPMVRDATVGLKMGERPPVRATIEGIQDGWVFWRDEDGNQQTDREEEFRRDLTTPPPARRGDRGVATEPSGLPTPPPAETGDISDFDPWAVREPSRRARTEDTGQSSMNLPETKQIQNLLDSARYMQATAAEAQRILDSGSPNARTPQDIALMRTQAAKALDEAAELQRKLTPARASQDATAATPEQMAARGLGPLAAAAPATSEATTGAQQFAVTPPKAPPAAAQGALAPVEGSEAENPQEPQFTPKAPEVPWQQRLRQRIADRSARVSMPSLLAKQLGVTPAEVTNELKTIAGSSPKSPIRMVATRMGGETSEGLFRYAPKPTGKVTQSLSDLVYDSGGMAAGSFAGELEARDLHTAKRAFKGALIRPAARMNVQDMADHALQLGWNIKPDETGDHADVDDFLNKLEQDDAGGRKFYARGESPEELGLDQGKGRPQATPADRKAAALARLDQLGFKPQGTTHQELEQQIDDYENAIGDFEPNNTLDFQRAMEQENVDRLNDEAKVALKEESREDYPDGYNAERLAAETRGSTPAALDEAVGGDAESGGAAGTEPNGESTAEGGGASANEAAAESGEAPGAETQTSRASTSQSGPTLPPQIIDKTAEAAAFIENGGSPSGWVLQEGKRTGNEHLVIMIDGKAVGATTSDLPKEVGYVVENQMYDPTQAVIIYHNHPIDAALSGDDIRALGYPGTSLVVAVSHSGEVSGAALSPGIHRWIAKQNPTKAAQFLRNIYTMVFDGMQGTEPNVFKRQELTLRALAGAGIIEYHSGHSIPGDHLVAVREAAKIVRSRFEKANIETDRTPNRSTFYQRTGDGLAAISRRHGEIRSQRQADVSLRGLGGSGAGGETGRNQTARNASEPGADRRSNDGRDSQSPTGVLARLIQDETGALDLDAWKKIRQLLRRGRASEGPAAAREVAREGLKIPIGQANTLQSLSLPARWFRTAVSLASIDRPSSIYWNALLRRDHVKTTLEREAIDAARPYLGLDVKARDRINKVLEHDRLFGIDRSNTGRTVVVKIPDRKPPFGERPELSKPGEIVALDKAESDALNSLRKFFDKRLMQMGEAAAVERGYNGEFTKAAIEERIRSANSPRERTIAAQALDIFNQTENMRRTGYVPFQRYGDTYIVIKPKANAEDETTWFELVSTKSAFDKAFSRPGGKNSPTLDERVAALKERFPEDDYDYQIDQASPKAIANLNIPAMEKAFAALNVKADKDTAKVIDQLMTQIFEARKAGLRKQANNVPGYCVTPDTDILTADMRWVKAGDLDEGSLVVGFDEDRLNGKRRKMRVGAVESARRVVLPCYEIALESGRLITVSADHKFLVDRRSGRLTRWIAARDLKIGTPLKTFPYSKQRTDFDGGWFSGILDGEGWLSKRRVGVRKSQLRLGWAQKEGDVMDRALEIARESGLDVKHFTQHGSRNVQSATMGPWDSMACLQLYRPTRLSPPDKWEGSPLPTAIEADNIVSITFVGDREVVAIQTSCRTYISNGICSHNCLDFERAIVDYVRQSSTIVAHVSSRNDVDSAYETVQKHPTTEVRDYWEAHQHHMEKEGGDYAGLRKFGFFMFLWGNPASAAINLTQTPLVTMMQLGTWAGPRAPGLAHGAMIQALRAVTVGKNGMEINWEALSRMLTEPEMAMIRTLQAEGRLDPVLSNEFQGFDRGRSKVRPHMKVLGRIYEAGASMFNTTETVNRIAAALAYFRASQNEQLREKAAKVYAKDQNWQEMVGRFPQPIDIARFGIDETQFIGGKLNRMPAMRGWGGVVLQFKTYIANYLRLLHKNATRMGPQGKAAAAAMLIALIMTSGLAGLPFGEDALNAVDGITKWVTGIDHNLEYQFRNWLDDAGFGEYWAEVATRGFGRDAFGLDVGGRLGMGNLFPDNSFTSLAPVVTGTVGNVADAIERYKSGQPIGAAAAVTPMFAGSGVANAIKGLVQYPNEGVATKRGNPLYWPDEVTTADMAIKALGFQPTRVTRAGEREFQANRIANATKDARASMLTNLTRNMILEEKARKAGDKEAANKYQARIDALMADNAAQLLDPSIPDWQKMKPPSRLGIKRRVQSMLAPDIARMKRASKLSREELSDLPFVDDE